MRQLRFLQYDVFTDRPFTGNQLAVFVAAEGLSSVTMQAIAQEMNYSESTFVLPATDPRALVRVRIFTPAAELPFAGHPTIGTTFALAHERRIRAGDASPVQLLLNIGLLPVDVLFEGENLSYAWMRQPLPEFRAWTGQRERLAAAVGLDVADLAGDLPIERGSAGVPFVYIPVRDRAALAKARPGPDLVASLADESPQVGAYLFAHDAESGSARSRMFGLAMGIAEDPATGSAAGPFGAYLLRHGRLSPDERGESHLQIAQGVEMGRASKLEVAITGAADNIREVRVGGTSVLVAEGTLLAPDDDAATEA
ncbi:MAG TPA: PhzF family phenazine biosynthesis protein [Ktedonobacterales bacterium]|nr:PhzF family phenazine biosynthesis protein [Ktedonobacterales bacterium]